MKIGQTNNLVSSQNRLVLRVDSVVPSSGTAAGGVTITVNGEGFLPGLTARLSGINCTNVNVLSSSVFTAVTGAGTTGQKTLRVRQAAAETFVDVINAFNYT